jgi:hypothetical protein
LYFLLIFVNALSSSSFAQLPRCLDKLPNKICVADETEACNQHASDQYAVTLREELKKLPDLFSKLTCELNHIEIGKRDGLLGQHFSFASKIYLNENLFKNNASLEREFDSFGLGLFNNEALYHYVDFKGATQPNALTYILAHELAHFLEHEFLMANAFHCLEVKKDAPALNKSRSCIHGCEKQFSEEKIRQQFALLDRSKYLTFYSLSSPREDFAELLSLRPLLEFVTITADFDITRLFNYNEQIEDPQLAPKLKIIDQLLNFPLHDADAAGREAYAHLTCQKNYKIEQKPPEPWHFQPDWAENP